MFAELDPLKPRLRKVRDLSVLEMDAGRLLVVACDSVGGIGSKPQDAVRAPEETVGAFAVRVPLFEILASGAVPFLIVDCLSVEMKGAGERILAGVKQYVSAAGLTDDVHFTGSSEENVPTVQTGVGITVLGMTQSGRFRPGSSSAGDVIACAGIPKSAPKFTLRMDDPELLSLEDLLALRRLPFVHDIVPVGSKGLFHEAGQLADSASLVFAPLESPAFDPYRSAGPCSCAVFSVDPANLPAAARSIGAPVFLIGELHARGAG